MSLSIYRICCNPSFTIFAKPLHYKMLRNLHLDLSPSTTHTETKKCCFCFSSNLTSFSTSSTCQNPLLSLTPSLSSTFANKYCSSSTNSKKSNNNNNNSRLSANEDPFCCWKCEKEIVGGSELGYLLCPSCGSPQRLSDDEGGAGGGGTRRRPSFYELLGEKKSYNVDVERLAATVKRLQKRLHPDLFAGSGEEEQRLSQELSSLINKAFSTLVNPIERGRYLLWMSGVEDPIGDVEKEVTNDPTFLEEVMELNERLEELDSEKDWRQFREDNDKVLKQLQSDLNVVFNNNKIEEAKIILARMKYFDTLQGKLKELKSKLNIVE